MSNLRGSRRPVKATYAHKRNRNSKIPPQMNPLSSPIEILGHCKEPDLTREEMTRRMLKRSRQVSQSSIQEDNQDSQVPERNKKRVKRSIVSTMPLQNEFSMSLNDLRPIDPTDVSQFQTPYGEEYIYPSLIAKPLIPEQMSPLPIAGRILSRTTSRNLKENTASSRSASSRGGVLASPFTSRHSSANSSPRSKSRSKSKLRPGLNPDRKTQSRSNSKSRTTRLALSTKSHSIASSHDKFGSNSQPNSYHEPTFTMNHSSHPSPLRHGQNPNPIIKNRYPSSHTLTQISKQDWLVPAKALTRTYPSDDIDMDTPPDFGVVVGGSVVGSSSFLADFPDAFSTPPLTRSSHHGHMVFAPSKSGLRTPDIADDLYHYRIRGSTVAHVNNGGLHDIVMNDDKPYRTLHIDGNSIISSSGDFTLRPSGSPASPAITSTVITQNIDENGNDAENETDSLFQTYDDIIQDPFRNIPRSKPKSKQPMLAHEITISPVARSASLVSPSLVPVPTVARSCSPSFVDELMASKVPAPTPISSPPTVESPESVLKEMFDDMGLDAGDAAHSIPPTSAKATLDVHTRSLDGPVSIRVDPAATDKAKQKTRRARDRAGTIRASDYQQIKALPVLAGANRSNSAGVAHAHTRRTRSGTIVGPSVTGVIVPPTPIIARDPRVGSSPHIPPQAQTLPTSEAEVLENDIETDDELLLKAPGWLDVDLEYLGLPTHKFYSRALEPPTEVDSDDELLLSGKWRDAYEDWPKEV